MTEESCKFCRIVNKKASASLVYEDDKALAFMDIHPMSEGHTLVIPKRHYETIYNIPDEEIAHLFKVVKRIANAVKKAVNAEGISIFQQNERAARQDVFHMHVHVVPRYEGKKLPHPSIILEANRQKLDEVARKIKQHI
jgi:histidine triad (HIT) family protein